MSFKKLFLALALFFAAVCSLSAVSVDLNLNYDGGLREPDSHKRRDDDLVGLIIKTNVEDAEVYINGKLFGTTPIATVDLSPTYYNLEIRKAGYDTISCKISLRRNYTYTYDFVMIRTCGYLNLTNIPSGSSVYVDGIGQSSFPIETDPGTHSVKVRKFGYEDYSAQVRVENHKTTNHQVSLKVSPFEIRDFKVSKSVINPDYNSGIGRANFSFYVTNDGSAILAVTDRYGNTVWSHEYNSFSTWEQSITWSGQGSGGERLPDGQYTVILYSYDYESSQRIKIDRSMIYPLSVPTASGSGLGNLPCALATGMNYVKLYTTFGPLLSVTDEKMSLYSVPVTAGILVDFADYFEIGASYGVFAAADKAVTQNKSPMKGGVSFKGTGSFDLTSELSLNIAGLMHYNYCSVYDFIPPDVDFGNGFGLGAALGLETSGAYFGLSADYSFGRTMNTRGSLRLSEGEAAANNLKYGIVASLQPTRNLRASAWAAMHNSKKLEAGAEFITMPAASAFCFDAKAWVMTDLDSKGKNLLINAQIGLSYLF